jgi:hypothetical protein
MSAAEHIYDAAEPAPDWLSLNDEVLRLGLLWVGNRLTGEFDGESRSTYLAARAALIGQGQPSALDLVSQCFCLAHWDEDVLLLALAPAIDGSIGPRYGALQGRTIATPCTPHVLARLLFGCDRLPVQALQRLTNDAPLRRFSLVMMEDYPPLPMEAAIQLPERVRDLLCGVRDTAAAADDVAQLSPVPLPERLESMAAALEQRDDDLVRLQIIGPAGAGRKALATEILARRGLGALNVKAHCPSSASMLARDAVLDGCGVILEVDATADQTSSLSRRLDYLVPLPLIFVSEAPLEGMEHIPVMRIDPLTPSERAMLWQRVIAGASEHEALTVAEQFALGPSRIAAIARQPGLAQRGLWAACRDLGARDLEALSTRITPRRAWEDIVLAPDTRTALDALVAQVTWRAEVNGAWGFRPVLGRATGVSALFAGPSGVGKTMAAEVLAGALQLDLYVVDLARVTSKFIGETEKILRRIFDAAERGGVVLFFDEADALFGKRSEVKDSHDRYANAEVSYLLQRMETYGGLAILATNLKTHLDTAFLRRLRMIVDFPLPDVTARLALWHRAIPETAPQGVIDWQQLARLDLSGGNISTIAANAAYCACADGGVIEMRYLRAAIAAEYRKLDRDASGLG